MSQTERTITIYEDGTFAGSGELHYTPEKGGQHFVCECPAELGSNSAESDAAYEAIDDAINAGSEAAETADHTYTWSIDDE